VIPSCNHNHTKVQYDFSRKSRAGKRAFLQKSTSISVIMIAIWYEASSTAQKQMGQLRKRSRVVFWQNL